MGDPEFVLLSSYGGEVHVPGQMEAPVLFEGQVSLLGTRELVSILHQLDGDVRGMEAAHVANQGVFLPILSWVTAVHLNLGWSVFAVL